MDYPDLPHIEVTNRGGDCEVRRKRVVPCRPKRRLDLQKTTTDIFQNILFEKAKYMAWQPSPALRREVVLGGIFMSE